MNMIKRRGPAEWLQWLSVLALLAGSCFWGPAPRAGADPAAGGELKVVAVEAGHYHTLALLSNGTVMAWGDNKVGQLGEGTTPGGIVLDNTPYPYAVPVQERVDGVVRPLTDVVAIAGGAQYSLALKRDGTVWSWGFNASGELGRTPEGNPYTSTAAERIPELSDIVQIAAADTHALALTAAGEVWAWGDNQLGQAGIGTGKGNFMYHPVQTLAQPDDPDDPPTPLAGIRQIAANGSHSMALTDDGRVLSWGYNGRYQLGDGTLTHRSYPGPVLLHDDDPADGDAKLPLTGIRTIAAGRYHNVALDDGGRLWTWGDNASGQLGLGHTGSGIKRASLVPGTAAERFEEIAAGGFHSIAIREDGAVWTWGHNRQGVLGRTGGNDSTPLPITAAAGGAPTTGYCAASGGEEHTVLLRCDGTLWAVGGNSMFGDLLGMLGGNLTALSVSEPVPVTLANLTETVWNDPTLAAGQPGEITLQLGFANTATPKTRYALPIGTDKVEMATDDSSLLGPVGYKGSGVFAAPFQANEAGTYVVTAKVNGIDVPDQATVRVTAAAPDAARSSLTASPGFAVADGNSAVAITLRLKDTYGNEVDIAPEDVVFTASLGEVGTASRRTDDGGAVAYTANLTSTSTGRAVIGATVGGIPLDLSAQVDFLAGAPDSSRFALTASPASLPADGASAATITLRMFDAQGNALTESGGAVRLLSDLGELGTVTESVYGVYQATLTSDRPGIATIGAERDGQLIAQTAAVRWMPVLTGISFAKPSYEAAVTNRVRTKVNARYSDDSSAELHAGVTWQVRDSAIATVDGNGYVTGRSRGTTVVTATYGAYQATAGVTVIDLPSTDDPPAETTPETNPGTNPDSPAEPGTGPNEPAEQPGGGDSDPGPGRAAPAFSDLSAHWAKEAIERGAGAGFVSGYPDGTFRPNGYVTRAEFVSMLARVIGGSGSRTPASPQAGETWPAWAAEAIGQAMAAGIAAGYPDGTFRPHAPITRAEMTVLASRALDLANRGLTPLGQPSRFRDEAEVPVWAKDAVATLAAAGLLAGDDRGRFRPADRSTRAEAVVLLLRIVDRSAN